METLRSEDEQELESFLEKIGAVLGRRERRESFAMYAMGLMGDGDRKSVEPIAARLSGDPSATDATQQRLLHFLVDSNWSDRDVRRVAAEHGLAAMTAEEQICAWTVDDTGFIKQGTHSVGVKRQYTGSAGKITNCQVGVSLTVSSYSFHLPIDFELYLPTDWTDDAARRAKARIPDNIEFRTKPKLALEMMDRALEDGVPPGVVLADSAYGDNSEFRSELRLRGLDYAVGVSSNTMVRRLDELGRCSGPKLTVKELAASLEVRRVTWRDGRKCRLTNRFSFRRVVPANYDPAIEMKHREDVWLIVEHPDNGDHIKYYLSTLPPKIAKRSLIRLLKERYRTEQVYREFKGQLGLDHYEGRRYPGWHHHVSVALCCYAFLVAEQARAFSPSRAWSNRLRALIGAA